jgi:hypothetical protein
MISNLVYEKNVKRRRNIRYIFSCRKHHKGQRLYTGNRTDPAEKLFLNLFFVGILKFNDENSRIRIQDPDSDPGSGSESGSTSHRHGSADPDPHQNVMNPEHCCPVSTVKKQTW